VIGDLFQLMINARFSQQEKGEAKDIPA